MDQESTEQDFFQYFDPSPSLEHETLDKFQNQIDFVPTIEKHVQNLKNFLYSAKNESDSIITQLKSLGVDPSFQTAYKSISDLLLTVANSITDEYKNNIENRKAYIPTILSGQRDAFVKTNSDFQKIVDEYGSLSPNIKINVLRASETPLQASMKQRAESFYDLSTSVKSCEKLLANASATAFLSFFKTASESMKNCTDQIDSQIEKMQESISNFNEDNLLGIVLEYVVGSSLSNYINGKDQKDISDSLNAGRSLGN